MKVQELLATSDKWTQGVMARDDLGDSVAFDDSDAVCWCLRGAISKCYRDPFDADEILSRVRARKGSIPAFNDDMKTTFEDIRSLIEVLDI